MGLMQWLGLSSTPVVADQVGALSPFVGPSHLGQVTLAHLLDLADAGAPVTRADAMAIPAVAKARHMIATQAARAFPVAMTGERRTPHQPAIITQPEGQARSRYLTLVWTFDAMIFFGRAWWIVQDRYWDDRPQRVLWVPEPHITWNDQGDVSAYGVRVAPQDVIRIDGPHEGLLNMAQTPLRAARALGISYGAQSANPVPTVELHQTGGDQLNRQEIQTLIADWVAARNGANGGVGYTSETIEAKVHGLPAEQLLIQGRKAVALEVAQLAGLPAWAVDAETSGSSMNYSNVQARTGELLDYSLAPYHDALAGRLSLDDVLPHGQWMRFATELLTRPDFKARMEGYQAAQAAGIYTADECKALETGTNPLEGIDA